MSTPNPELRQAYESALTNAGVPVNLASQCAEIVAKDDPESPNLGRSEDDQHLIESSMEWMKAKGFFSR
jgi:hypothetical protein